MVKSLSFIMYDINLTFSKNIYLKETLFMLKYTKIFWMFNYHTDVNVLLYTMK